MNRVPVVTLVAVLLSCSSTPPADDFYTGEDFELAEPIKACAVLGQEGSLCSDWRNCAPLAVLKSGERSDEQWACRPQRIVFCENKKTPILCYATLRACSKEHKGCVRVHLTGGFGDDRDE